MHALTTSGVRSSRVPAAGNLKKEVSNELEVKLLKKKKIQNQECCKCLIVEANVMFITSSAFLHPILVSVPINPVRYPRQDNQVGRGRIDGKKTDSHIV